MSDLHTYKVMQQGDADAKPPDRGQANAWLVVVVSLVLLIVVVAILFPVFAKAPMGHHGPSTISNLKVIGLANIMYSSDYDEHLPPADTWMDAYFDPYLGEIRYCIDPRMEDRKEGEHGFAFLSALSCVDTTSVAKPETAPLVFQSSLLGRNAHSDLSTLPTVPRGGEVNSVVFLDGHVKSFPPTWPETPVTIVMTK